MFDKFYIMLNGSAYDKSNADNSISEYNNDTVNLILDVIKDEYKAEDDRNIHIEDKAKSLVTLSGLLITLCLGIIKAIHDYNWFDWLILFLLFVVILLVITIWKLLQILKVTGFHRINFNHITTNSAMRDKAPDVCSRLIVTYEEAILKNRSVIDKKMSDFRYSVSLIEGSIFIILFVVILISIQNTDYVEKLLNKTEIVSRHNRLDDKTNCYKLYSSTCLNKLHIISK